MDQIATRHLAAWLLAAIGLMPAMALAAPAPLHLQDRAFLLYTLEQDLAQIELGRLAAEKAAGEPVRVLAGRVADYHQQSRDRLSEVARRQGLEPPAALSPLARRSQASLQALSGAAFDRSYLATQVIWDYSAHFGARREMLHGFDRELREVAARQAEEMTDHRREAERAARDLGSPPGLAVEDRSFLLYAMHVDLAQEGFARIAAERAQDERVRALARRLVAYHEASYDRLARIARAGGIEPLTELSSISLRTRDGMQRLSGLPLDWTYLNAHAFTSYNAHYRYEREAIHGRDPELRALAAQAAREARRDHHDALDIMAGWDWSAS